MVSIIAILQLFFLILIICLRTVKWLHVLLFNTNFIFKTIHFPTVKWFQVFLCITNYSIKHPSFVYTQLNGQIVLHVTIQYNKTHLFAQFKFQTVLFGQ